MGNLTLTVTSSATARAADAGTSRVAVVVLHYNGLPDTLQCLESLRAAAGSDCRVIVVDNGSAPPAGEAIRAAHPWVEVLVRQDNGGWAGGNNTGIRRALERGAEFVVLLNNDTIVAPELLDQLTTAAGAAPEFDVLGVVVCYLDEPDRVNVDGCRFHEPGSGSFFTRHPIPCDGSDSGGVTETELVNGCCMMVRAEVFRKIGLIDERFFLIHEESEFCLRARQAGYRCGVVGRPLVWHKGSSSFQREPRPLQCYFDARNLYLILKEHPRSTRRGRSRWLIWRDYVRHVYFMYCWQREAGSRAGADAVLEGVCDALSGRWGAYPRSKTRWLLPGLRRLFEWRRRRGGERPPG